ncbi:hypothetical protein LPB140_01285 [Sphingorhabdus lutea]|uniref:Glycosyltransferase RgtA/B/C/D-like domain-containing protein n=1 Tax=Sphingorhabdus lutea TaxID=1913578 RepID=A0A1L3J9C0_9SPHN|nr:hypothetical protein [Sphingorhabdus lutea]APG61693.1 hypothetical protein LPB140_01285 [Sphingorhabdus lutea]
MDNMARDKQGWIRQYGSYLLTWLIGCAVIIYFKQPSLSPWDSFDPDDRLRLVQIRDFLAGQSWFDNSQYRMNPPDGAPMHWSRLIEIPYYLLTYILTPLFGQVKALAIATIIVPLSLLGIMSWNMGQIVRQLGGGLLARHLAMIIPFTLTAIFEQFSPMRIDHHGWQIMLSIIALYLLMREKEGLYAFGAGILLACALHISLESLVMSAAFFGWLGIRWIAGFADERRIKQSIAGLAVGSATLYLVATNPAQYLIPYCDAISPPYLAALGAAAIIMLIGTSLKPQKWWVRLFIAALAGGSAIALIYLISPICTKGAFSQLDPLVYRYWYLNINEGLPIWNQKFDGAALRITPPLLMMIALIAILLKQRQHISRQYLCYGYFLLTSLLLACLVWRGVALANAIAVPFIALTIEKLFNLWRREKSIAKRMAAIGAILAILLAGPLLVEMKDSFKAAPKMTNGQIAANKEKIDLKKCNSPRSIMTLDILIKKPSLMLSSFNLGPSILLQTRHSVLASSHHRNDKAMHDQLEIFRQPAAVSAKFIKKHNIDYIIICKGDGEFRLYRKIAPNGLGNNLVNGKLPPYIDRVEVNEDGLQIFHINRKYL